MSNSSSVRAVELASSLALRVPADASGFPLLADPGCANALDDSEKSPALVCDDDADNDGDGTIDWDGGAESGTPDPECRSASWNGEKASMRGLGAELVIALRRIPAIPDRGGSVQRDRGLATSTRVSVPRSSRTDGPSPAAHLRSIRFRSASPVAAARASSRRPCAACVPPATPRPPHRPAR